jgi:hypothetical protein
MTRLADQTCSECFSASVGTLYFLLRGKKIDFWGKNQKVVFRPETPIFIVRSLCKAAHSIEHNILPKKGQYIFDTEKAEKTKIVKKKFFFMENFIMVKKPEGYIQ